MLARRNSIIWIAFYVLGLPSTAEAATARGLIERNAGYPAANIKVSLRGVNTEPVYTDNDGRYYFKNIPAGEYILEIWNQKLRPSLFKIRIKESVTVIPRISVP